MYTNMKGYILATIAGFCGALASLTGKLISYQSFFKDKCLKNFIEIINDAQWYCWYFASTVQILFIIVTLILNSIMWTVFVESMQHLGSSEAMVINIATNIFMSALCGWLIFAEQLSFLWWLGAVFILSGLSILLVPSSNTIKTD